MSTPAWFVGTTGGVLCVGLWVQIESVTIKKKYLKAFIDGTLDLQQFAAKSIAKNGTVAQVCLKPLPT